MQNILVTGGSGFIGSHTCLALLKKKYRVFVIDSFSNSSKKALNRVNDILKFGDQNFVNKIKVFEGNLCDIKFLEKVFNNLCNQKISIDGVIHFAGLKSVSESIKSPLIYWRENLVGTINLLEIMKKNNCKTLVFSSSATVYGDTGNIKLKENFLSNPTNSYGNTKLAIEKLLKNMSESSEFNWKFASLRYFNPIGAHDSGLIGESPKGEPNNIFPLIMNTALGLQKELKVYGKDWPTKDGTAIRDYIHIMDVAESHVKVLEYLSIKKSINLTLNIGTGIETSVLDLIKTFERVINIKIPYTFCERRQGDVPYLVADNNLAASKFMILPFRNIEDMCRDGWKWRKLNPNGY